MSNKFNKLLIWALIAYFGNAKLEAYIYQSSDEVIPGDSLTFKGGEHAWLGGEPGPVMFERIQNDEHMLGTDTASRPPVKHILGTNSDTYTPLWLDNQQNLNEIKRNQKPELTNEQILEGLADLFEQKPQAIEEPIFDDNLEKYFDELAKQIADFNKDIKSMLTQEKIQELADKYPLIVNGYKEVSEDDNNYSDMMHSGLETSEQAPDLGEIKPIENNMDMSSDINLGNE